MGLKKAINAIFQFLRGLFFGAIVIASFFFCVLALHVFTKQEKSSKSEMISSEDVTLIVDTTAQGIDKYYVSHQSWMDFDRKQHRLPFKVDFNNVLLSKKNRNKLEIPFRGDHLHFWGTFYNNLANHDRPLVEGLAQTFYEYQKGKNMGRREFAELMITAIQDIPYSLILSDKCGMEDAKSCVGNVKMGLYAPAEFIAYLDGDCDTRTVLLFTLLSRFQYDVAILNSTEYRHSILGLQINSTGKYKSYKRRKYYFVETTSRQNPIGYLHPDYSELDHWDVVLTN